MEKADEWGIQQLSEEQFFNFIKEKIENYDPLQDNGIEEKKPTKKVAAAKVKAGAVAVPKQLPGSKKGDTNGSVKQKKVVVKNEKNSRKSVKIEDDVDEKPPATGMKKKPSRRARATIEIEMAEEGSGDAPAAVVPSKRIKKEASGKSSDKKSLSQSAIEETSAESGVKDEPVSEGETEVPQVSEKKARRKKEPKVAIEPVVSVGAESLDQKPDSAKRGRGRPKKHV